ncbi:MAG TPA: polysaccharide biosynthesis protein, partial [Maribacter sp.]|nr:polysaccharide biosynthesis protein [Maribacter sp.]
MTYFNLPNNINRFASKWIVLAIDVIMVSVCFILSYCIRFNLTFDFDVNKLLVQLPLVCLITSISFLIIGSYKGVIRHTGVRDVYNIFNTICLSSILLIIMVLINKQLDVLENFTIPLSIIIIYSLLSFIGLTASRFVFKSMYNAILKKDIKFH